MIIRILDFLIEQGENGSLIGFQSRLEGNEVYFTVELEWMLEKKPPELAIFFAIHT